MDKVGKTALAMNIAENAAILDGKVVGVFSLEMSKEALLMRMLASHAQVDSHKLRTGFLGKEDMQKLTHAMEGLMQARLFIDDTPGISVTEMRSKARRLKQQEQRLDLIIVDYLQLMSAVPIGGKRFENRTQEVSAISRGLKAVAKELKVPVVALPKAAEATIVHNSPTCANPAPSSRTPTSWPSSSAKRSTKRTIPTSKASPNSSSRNSATAPPASSSWPSSTRPRASKTWPPRATISSRTGAIRHDFFYCD